MGAIYKEPKEMKENIKSEKRFLYRNSTLTNVFASENGKIVYTIYLITVFGLFLNQTARGYIKYNKFDCGFDYIIEGFHNFHYTILSWFIVFGLISIAYGIFLVWSKYTDKSSKILNGFSFGFLLLFYTFNFHLCAYLMKKLEMGHASCFFIATEQTRLLMKLHACIRSNLHKSTNLPKYSYFVLFTFFPTLVYRDSYPRTRRINWKSAMHSLFECISALFLFSYTLQPLFSSNVQKFGTEVLPVSLIIDLTFKHVITGIMVLLISFFLVLHSVQNFFAEITRFGDRLFYEDWWNAKDYSEWFRTWNIVVHDWLYLYIYKDSMKYFVPGNRTVARLAVFATSAIVHEWVLSSALGFWFPILFVQFFVFGGGFSVLRFPKNVVSNIIVLYGLGFGMGSLLTMYSVEYFIRLNIPAITDKTHFLPAVISCNCIHF